MKLLIILCALVIEQSLEGWEHLRRLDWFHGVIGWLNQTLKGSNLWRGVFGPMVVLLPPLLLLSSGLMVFNKALPLLSAILGLAVLVYCLGPRNLHRETQEYLLALTKRDRNETARLFHALVGEGEERNPRAQHRQIAEAVFMRANERLFGVLFWFAVMGPLAAAFYRLVTELKAYKGKPGLPPDFVSSVNDMQAVLNWLPARLLAFSYALMGSLIHAMQAWDMRASLRLEDNELVLKQSGLGALQYDIQQEAPGGLHDVKDTYVINAALKLVTRSLVLWISALTLLSFAT
jgi:membrane protein required for beta-lactamase induction